MTYPHIDPVLIHIGPLQVRWYGLMYVIGFLAAYLLLRHQEKARPIGLSPDLLQDLIFYLVVGLVIGARLGYILFYQYMNLIDYIRHPLEIIAVWHGGMSFHGGLIGTAIAAWWFSKRKQFPFLSIADRIIIAAPIGLGLGRMGKLHQRRTIWSDFRSSVGHGLSRWRTFGQASLSTLRGHFGRAGIVSDPLVAEQAKNARWFSSGNISHGVWGLPLFR